VLLILLVLVTRSAAQSTIDTKLAAQYFSQLKQSSDRDGGKTWGLPLYGPIMFVDPRSLPEHTQSSANSSSPLRNTDGMTLG
jgi:hypothetical protein